MKPEYVDPFMEGLMNFASLWDGFSSWIICIGLPATAVYHNMCSNHFLNVAAEDAGGLEKAANVCFIPVQYLLAGKVAKPVLSEDGVKIGYKLEQRFSYTDDAFWWKTAAAYCALPTSFFVGSILKGVSLLSSDTASRAEAISRSVSQGGSFLQLNNDYYDSVGIAITNIENAEVMQSQGYPRRPGDEARLKPEKQALKEITTRLHEAGIMYWLDCGSCLGAYRHGGSIPWDWDLDMAVLQKDSDNVRAVLSSLDPEKYAVQDWSSRDKPNSYLKVYVRETGALIDVYHFNIDEKEKTVKWILSNVDCVFLPESWKIRERSYVVTTPFDYVFPLKKADFDGVEVFVPRATEEYLLQRYGNIQPARVYDPVTGNYEKVPGHPYWEKSSR